MGRAWREILVPVPHLPNPQFPHLYSTPRNGLCDFSVLFLEGSPQKTEFSHQEGPTSCSTVPPPVYSDMGGLCVHGRWPSMQSGGGKAYKGRQSMGGCHVWSWQRQQGQGVCPSQLFLLPSSQSQLRVRGNKDMSFLFP